MVALYQVTVWNVLLSCRDRRDSSPDNMQQEGIALAKRKQRGSLTKVVVLAMKR